MSRNGNWVDGVCQTCGDVELGCDLCGENHGAGPCPRVEQAQLRRAATPKELTPGEMSSLEKVAKLRGQLGTLRRKVRKAHRLLLEFEHTSSSPGYPLEALTLLSEALNEK